MITFETDNGRFNMRVAGLALAEGCVLLHQMHGDSFWTLPGGRPEMMETAAAALHREMLEETGIVVDVGRPLCVVENFFTYGAMPFHEILLCFEMTLPSHVGSPDHRFHSNEDGRQLTFWWCPPGVLDTVSLRPALLRPLIERPPATFIHVVEDDRLQSPRRGQ